jgi:hypothetical protein
VFLITNPTFWPNEANGLNQNKIKDMPPPRRWRAMESSSGGLVSAHPGPAPMRTAAREASDVERCHAQQFAFRDTEMQEKNSALNSPLRQAEV